MQQEQDPAQEKRVLLAIALSVLALWVFNTFLAPPPPPAPEPLQAPAAAAPAGAQAAAPGAAAGQPGSIASGNAGTLGATDAAAPASSGAAAPALAASVEPARSFERAWDGVRSTWSSRGGSPLGFEIPAYRKRYEQLWLPSWLISGFGNGFRWEPFSIACNNSGPEQIVGDPEGVLLPVGFGAGGLAEDVSSYRVVREEQGALEFAALRGELEIVKSYTLPAAGHALGYRVTVRNLGGSPQKLDPVFGVADRAVASDSRYGPQTTLSAGVDGDLESWDSKAVEKKERGAAGTVDWLAFGERYFMVGLEPRQPVAGEVRMSSAGPAGGRLQAALRLPAVELPAGQSLSWDFSVWAGPRELEGLRAAGLRLRDSVDFGFFGALALPILWFLKFLHGLLGSWGGAIILLTVTVKALLFPLSQKSFKSMKDMQKLQPQIKELQEKYKDDREQLNREMMALWQKHGVNPMGGCMPIVVQMPIWFALYQVLWQSVELYQSPFLYFCDLSLRDPLGVFPTALGASMILQQRMTPTTGMDPAQQQVMKWMPVFFSLLMFTLPAGLVVYILVNNILSIAQQWVIQRQHGGPVAAAPGASAAAGAKKGS